MKTIYIDDLEGLDPNNFWFRAKERYLGRLIKNSNATILDVGCGNGRNMSSFIEQGYKVIGIDINENAINFCRKKGYKVFKSDLQHETPKIGTSPEYITALDFIEHVANPVQVFQRLTAVANHETQLIVTVPAYQFLFSSWDRAMGHIKRYTLPLLCNELEEGGWDITKATYIHFVPLIPAILVRKIIDPIIKNIGKGHKKKETKFFNPHPVLNHLLSLFYYPEFILFNLNIPIPIGLSILATAVPKRI